MLIALFLAACSADRTPTQGPVVVDATRAACGERPPGRDALERVLATARCEHADMLVHPRSYLLRRVPSGPNVARFTLVQTTTGATECCYEADAEGRVTHRP